MLKRTCCLQWSLSRGWISRVVVEALESRTLPLVLKTPLRLQFIGLACLCYSLMLCNLDQYCLAVCRFSFLLLTPFCRLGYVHLCLGYYTPYKKPLHHFLAQ